jgi:hypothetical protein
MKTEVSVRSLLTHPSAFVPIAMSLAALSVVIVHVVMFGAAREPDEGAAAHIWQLLMVAQIPVIVFFASKWLRLAPREAWVILALQLAAAAVAVAPVYCLGL